MTITERTRPYEILIRQHEDGSIGAHQQVITEVLRDGAVIAADVKVIPLDEAGLTAVIGVAAATALVHIDELAAQLAAVRAERDDLMAALADVAAERDRLAALLPQGSGGA